MFTKSCTCIIIIIIIYRSVIKKYTLLKPNTSLKTIFIIQTQLLARLASVHRSVVRTMQNFMKYLYDQDSDRNMARVQQELAALIRQLSLCATRLQIAGDSHVPEAVSELLKEAAVSFIVDTCMHLCISLFSLYKYVIKY